MLISLPHNVPVNLRPCGVSFPNDESLSGDNSQTVAKAGLKRRAEVVQREFEAFLLLQGDVWVGRFRRTSCITSSACCAGLNCSGALSDSAGLPLDMYVSDLTSFVLATLLAAASPGV